MTDYTNHPIFSGESVDYTRHMSFAQGNAFMYLWRLRGEEDMYADLDEALWYLKNDSLVLKLPLELTRPLAHRLREYTDKPGYTNRQYRIGWAMLSTAQGDFESAIIHLEGLGE